ncbi:MAG TPA: hypothetical protein VGT02_04680 [Methylomirabilota bacterium]|jgi:hypothetical protein|nr:hypothetical protein [Methylomirabilota bacterium]
MRTLCAAVAMAAVLVGSSAPLAAERAAVPPDFSLRAEYYPPIPNAPSWAPGAEPPGLKRWHPWTLTLGADGRAEQESNRTVPGKKKIVRKSVRVSSRDLQRLVTEVRRANFYLLAPEYAFEVTHHPTLVLRIAMEGRSHEVTIYGPDRLRGQPEVAAFLRVWNETLRIVPALNPGQRAD